MNAKREAAGVVIRARSVVTMDGPVIDNGAVVVRGSRITEVGPFSQIGRGGADELIDLGECALLPGLINAHCHLDYTGLRGKISRQRSFTDWIRAINEAKASLTRDDYVRSIDDGFAEAAQFGTTTIVNFVADPAVLSSIQPPRMRTWWLAEMIDVRREISVPALRDEMRRAFPTMSNTGFGLAPHAPYTASAKLYSDVSAAGAADDLLLSTHLAESREEMEMFRSGSGELFDFMSAIGRPMDDCGQGTPLALLLQRGVLDENWIVAHLNELADDDLPSLRGSPRFHVAHCPRSHAFFGHAPFQMESLRALGFNVCLGTDSLASNSDLGLFGEMQELSRVHPSLSPVEILAMVTVNPAKALRRANELGKLRPGYVADLIAVPTHADRGNALLDEMVNFEGNVAWSMVCGDQLTSA